MFYKARGHKVPKACSCMCISIVVYVLSATVSTKSLLLHNEWCYSELLCVMKLHPHMQSTDQFFSEACQEFSDQLIQRDPTYFSPVE